MSSFSFSHEFLGVPVQAEDIESTLKAWWEQSAGVKMRTSLLNLVIYTESLADFEHRGRGIAQVVARHPCRVILVFSDCNCSDSKMQCWINAYCHSLGQTQVCSEQITFYIPGSQLLALPGLLLAHLGSDLPLCVWWQAPLRRLKEVSWWIQGDRFLIDSQSEEAFRMLVQGLPELLTAKLLTCLSDLNWSRLFHWRLAVANLFDAPWAWQHLEQIYQITLKYAPGSHSAAWLLLGWFATQLGWRNSRQDRSDAGPVWVTPAGKEVSFVLTELPINRNIEQLKERQMPGIQSFSLEAPEWILEVEETIAAEERIFQWNWHQGRDAQKVANISAAVSTGYPELLLRAPAGGERAEELLVMELSRGSTHPVFLNTLENLRACFNSTFIK